MDEEGAADGAAEQSIAEDAPAERMRPHSPHAEVDEAAERTQPCTDQRQGDSATQGDLTNDCLVVSDPALRGLPRGDSQQPHREPAEHSTH
jgi:hypothetical protein